MAWLFAVLDIKFIDEFLNAHIMMLSYALEDAGKGFHFDWMVHWDHFVMFPVALGSDARMGTTATNCFVA